MDDVKAGWKTTEFWLSVVAVLTGLVMASGAVADESGLGKFLGVLAAALASAGYSVSRGKAKAG